MTQYTDLFERAGQRFEVPVMPFDGVLGRRDRKRRNQRIVAGLLAMVVAVAAFGVALRIGRSTDTVPAGPVSVMWTDTFGSSLLDLATATATDGSGIFVAGYEDHHPSDVGDDRTFLRMYNAEGTPVWETVLGASPDVRVLVEGIAADGQALYMVGSVDEWPVDGVFTGHSGGFFLKKFDLAGNEVWSHDLQQIAPNAVAARGGSVYVAGQSSVGGRSDAVLSRFDTDGNEIWGRAFGTPYGDSVDDLGIDAAGNVYFTGTLGYWHPCYSPRTQGCDGSENRVGQTFIRAFDAAGGRLWDVDLGQTDYRSGFALGPNAVYVAYRVGTAQLVRAEGLDGRDVWTAHVSDSAQVYGVTLTADDDGVFVAGGPSITKLDLEGSPSWSFEIPSDWSEWWVKGGAVAYADGIVVAGSIGGSRGEAFVARLGSGA